MAGITTIESPLFNKLFASFALVAVGTALLFSAAILYVNHNNLAQEVEKSLSEKSALAIPVALKILEDRKASKKNYDFLKEIAHKSHNRITVLNIKGLPIAETDADKQSMDNHSTRPEVSHARLYSTGSAWRKSKTLGIDMVYFARRIDQNSKPIGFIRLAYNAEHIHTKTKELALTILIITGISILLAIPFGYFWASRISKPVKDMTVLCEKIIDGDLNIKAQLKSNNEFSILENTLVKMSSELSTKIDALSHEKGQIKDIMGNMEDGLIVIDNDQRVRFCNQATYEILPTNEVDCRGKLLKNVAGFEQVFEAIKEAPENKQSIITECRIQNNQNNFYNTIEIKVSRPKRIAGYIVLLRDVTSLRKLERIRRDFVTNVSHELKTPLSTIKGYAETLLDGALEDKAVNKRFVEKILRNSERLTSLVMDLLNLSKIESTSAIDKNDLITWKSVFDKVYFHHEDNLKRKKIAFTLSDETNQKKFKTNEESLTQIIDNLLSNAIRYTPENGSVNVEIVEDKRQFFLKVSDSGIGIPEKDLHKIFERFYRVDKARSTAEGGTGLGLSIVKNLAEQLNGIISVSSEQGKGSVFTLSMNIL